MLSAIEQTVQNSLKKSIEAAFTGYNNPVQQFVKGAMEANGPNIQALLTEAVRGLLDSEEFREELTTAIRAKVAKGIVSKMGGEVEKRLNELRANPETRAKLTSAIMSCVQ